MKCEQINPIALKQCMRCKHERCENCKEWENQVSEEGLEGRKSEIFSIKRGLGVNFVGSGVVEVGLAK